jgi:hypothetical protein
VLIGVKSIAWEALYIDVYRLYIQYMRLLLSGGKANLSAGDFSRPYVRRDPRGGPSHGMQDTRIEPASRHGASCMGDRPDESYHVLSDAN